MEPTEPESDQQKDSAGQKRERFAQKLAGFSPIFEAAVACAAVVGLVLVILQIYYMGESNRMTRESLILAQESSKASDREVKRTLELMEESNRLTREALKASKEQAETSRNDAAASLALARRSAEESRRAFEIAQDARLGIEDVEPFHFSESTSGVIVIRVKNSGLIPAINVRSVIRQEIRSSDSPPTLPPKLEPTLTMDIAGGATISLHLRTPPRERADLDAIKQGGYRFYLTGVIRYSDVFGHQHKLIFCQAYVPAEGDWAICAPPKDTEGQAARQ